MIWTPERQAVWDRMRADDNVWWRELRREADATGTPAGRAGDMGGYATLAYQITGDRAYARKAWSRIEPVLGTTPGDRNFTREAFIGHVWMYDWLYPTLTAEQRRRYIDTLNHWADMVLGKTKLPGWGTRLDDSDENIGHYFGLACLDLATAPDNPRAGSFLREPQVGGLDATASNETTTMRNSIRRFAETAEGGEWIESSMYNPNTMGLLFMGAEAVRTATGVDHFPELTRLAPQVARAQIYSTTPDLRHEYQWGDNEQPRVPELMNRVSFLGLLAGLVQDDPSAGPYVHRFTEELSHQGPSVDPQHWGEHPFPHFYLTYNPYAPSADWRQHLSPGLFARGQGVLYFHSGWAADDSFFGAHMATRPEVDHQVGYFGDFQLYRHGEWAITHPIGYGGYAVAGDSTNTMLLAGLSSMAEKRHWTAQEFGPDGKYAYLSGTTSGGFYQQPYYDPPPAFVDEWSRSLFYLPSSRRRTDTVVVFDRTRARNPQKLPKFDRYYPEARTKIASAPALKQWLIHLPVRPELGPGAVRWRTEGGQEVRLSTLLPADQKRTITEDKQLLGPSHNFFDSELKLVLTITPAADRDWVTFLNVIAVSDSGQSPKAQLVRAAGEEAAGALIVRPGEDDTLIMFGARPQGRVLYSGYTVRWTATTAATDVFLPDLDPHKRWTFRVNQGPESPLTVSGQGMGRIPLKGADPGSRSLDVKAK